jgi:hypothetical protein
MAVDCTTFGDDAVRLCRLPPAGLGGVARVAVLADAVRRWIRPASIRAAWNLLCII